MYCWIKDHKGSVEAFIQGNERCEEYFTDGMCDLCAMEYQDGVCYTDHTPIKANYPVPAIPMKAVIGMAYGFPEVAWYMYCNSRYGYRWVLTKIWN